MAIFWKINLKGTKNTLRLYYKYKLLVAVYCANIWNTEIGKIKTFLICQNRWYICLCFKGPKFSEFTLGKNEWNFGNISFESWINFFFITIKRQYIRENFEKSLWIRSYTGYSVTSNNTFREHGEIPTVMPTSAESTLSRRTWRTSRLPNQEAQKVGTVHYVTLAPGNRAPLSRFVT